MMRRIVRDPRNLPFALSLIVALLIVPETPSPAARPTAGWRGWYLLLYREEGAPAIEAALRAASPGSVSRAVATARIDAFSAIETLPVGALEARLDPLDPRADAWLKGVGGYFQAADGGPVAVAYVPATRGRIAAWRRLARIFRAGGVPQDSWRLLEIELFAMLSVPVAAFGFALALAAWLRRQTRRGMLLAAAGVLAWLPCLLNGGLPELCICCLSLYLWLPHARDEDGHEPGSRPSLRPGQTGIRIGVRLCVVGLLVLADGAALYRVARMAASMLCLELFAEVAWSLRQLCAPRQRARALFEPVPIRVPRRRAASVPLAAALGAGILVTLSTSTSPLRIPLPRVVSLASAGSRTGLEAAARRGTADRLPGLAEAAGHAASLQTIAFGAAIDGDVRVGGSTLPLPPREGRVRLREYAGGSAGGSPVEAPRTVVRFDPGWLDRLVAGFGAGSVERLLIGQGRAVEVRLAAPWTVLLRAVPSVLACLVLLGAPLAGPAARRRLMRLGLWAITEPARRRRTE